MFAKGEKTVSKEELLSLFTEEQILCRYFPQIKGLPQTICSPFRKDEHPSVGISVWKDHIVWKDFAKGEKGNLWTLLEKALSVSSRKIYTRVYTDMLGTVAVGIKLKSPAMRKSYAECEMGTVKREWEDYDFEYWASYGISKRFLKSSGTFPISYILLKCKGITTVIKADKYAYVYIEKKDDIVTQKVYQPFNTNGFKWRSSSNASVWNLWTMLPETGDNLIITSSKKDAMCIWDNTGIPSVCPQSEGTDLKEHVVQQLKDRFKSIYVLYDNDFGRDINPGREAGRKLAEQFDLIQIEIPEELEAKDPSDLFKKHGKKTFIKTITSLIKNYG